MSDTGSNQTLHARVIREVFGYGAIGILLAVFVWQGIRALNTFYPIWIQHFADDAKASLQQTAALQQISATMSAMRTEMKVNQDALSGTISVVCTRKR